MTSQAPFLNVSDALASTYPPFAKDPQTPWPATDGKVGMPRLATDGLGAANPWNEPRSLVLSPGETLSIGLKLRLAEGGPRMRDATLSAMGCAVVRAVPGYVLPSDLASASLFVKPPPGAAVVAATPVVSSAVNATLAIRKAEPAAAATAKASGFEAFSVVASGYGRVRVNITFDDGTSTSVHYHALPPLRQQVNRHGVPSRVHFFLVIPSDPFRSLPIPSDPFRSLPIPSDPFRSLPIPFDSSRRWLPSAHTSPTSHGCRATTPTPSAARPL